MAVAITEGGKEWVDIKQKLQVFAGAWRVYVGCSLACTYPRPAVASNSGSGKPSRRAACECGCL